MYHILFRTKHFNIENHFQVTFPVSIRTCSLSTVTHFTIIIILLLVYSYYILIRYLWFTTLNNWTFTAVQINAVGNYD